jgi:hypothetical protein
MAFHSKKPSTGSMQRRRRYASRNVQSVNGLAFGVNWLTATFRILTPVRNEAPPERVERELAGLVITPDHQEALAWRAVPARRLVVDVAVADVHPVHDAIPYRRAALDDPPAHDG